MEEKVRFLTGVTATKGPRLDLIPYAALVSLADRFELGLERHKDGVWNARDDKEFPADLEWVMSRLSHIIDHAYKAMGKITGTIPEDGEDDAGAIMWGGAFLACYKEHMRKEEGVLLARHTVESEMPADPRPEQETLFPVLSDAAQSKLRNIKWPIEANPLTICAEITELCNLKYIEALETSAHDSPGQYSWFLTKQGTAWRESNK